MASWQAFEEAEPEMAALGRALLLRHQVAYLATLRHDDGGPRVHQVCPCIAGPDLTLAIGPRSPKLRDLRTDGRVMLHFMCGEEDAEFNARGRAVEVAEAAEEVRIRGDANSQGIHYAEGEIIFRVEIERADCTRWEGFGTPAIRPLRRKWLAPPGEDGG